MAIVRNYDKNFREKNSAPQMIQSIVFSLYLWEILLSLCRTQAEPTEQGLVFDFIFTKVGTENDVELAGI